MHTPLASYVAHGGFLDTKFAAEFDSINPMILVISLVSAEIGSS